jgi:hypothetical protein
MHKQEINQIYILSANKHKGSIDISCSYSSDGSRPQVQYEAVLDRRQTPPRSFLLQYDAMRSFSHDSEIFAFHRQSEPTNTKQRRSQ